MEMISNKLVRPSGMKHKLFIRNVLRHQWPEVNRIRLGKIGIVQAIAITEWCHENCAEWYCSDGFEVFYFPSWQNALAFRLTWDGHHHNEDFEER